MRSQARIASDRLLEDRRARRRLGVVMACLAASGWDFALAEGLVTGLAGFAAAALIATALLRLAPRWHSVAGPVPDGAVFAIGFVAVAVAPVWVSAVDPGSDLASLSWRHVLVAAVVWPGIGAVVEASSRSLEPSPRGLVLAVGGPSAALLIWIGETTAFAASRAWGHGRIAAAVALCTAIVALLVVAASRWIRTLLDHARERSRVEAAETFERTRAELASTLAKVEQRFEAIGVDVSHRDTAMLSGRYQSR